MIIRNSKTHWSIQFPSLGAAVDYISSTPESPQWKQRASKTERAKPGWDLGAGYAGALALAKTGWEEGICKISALAATVPHSSTYEQSYGVAGERPDVARYLAGDPRNMVHRGKTQKPKPVMYLCVSGSASSSITSTEMWNFGAAMVALVDRLESRHVRVELAVVFPINMHGKTYSFSWTVKRAEDALDLSAVAFSLAHPAAFRRIGFALIERCPSQEHYGYGMPENRLSADNFADAPQDALMIGGIGHNPGACRTMEGALAYAKRRINDAAGEPIAELEEEMA